MANKIDSNITGLFYAEEQTFKTLPGSPIWYGLEPNSYSNFGGTLKRVARAPIDPTRQNKKGAIVDNDAQGGFNIDFTKNNLNNLLQGLFFADAREKPSTDLLNSAAVPLTSVTSGTKTYAAASSLAQFNRAGYILNATGFTNAANNGLKTVASATTTTVVVNETCVTEAAPPATARLDCVGFQFPSADVQITMVGNIVTLVATATVMNTLGLVEGETIFIGGDTLASNRFVNNVGYGRISVITATTLTFDDVTWLTPVNEVSTGKTIQIFFGTVIKNESNPALIKRRSYNFERQLGSGPTSTQAEYLEGAVVNEFKLNVPEASKLSVDLSVVAANNTYLSGESGFAIKSGTRVGSLGEGAFNTSSNIYRIKLAQVDPTTSTPTSLFGYVTESSVSIKNGIKPNKAVGVLGAFDVSASNFEVSGSVTAYFSTTAALSAIRNNADIGLQQIFAANNAGFIFDIPLLGLDGGEVNITKDEPIKVPVTPAGAANKNNYTAMYNAFLYLPTIAMPT